MEQHPVPQNVTTFQFRLIGDMTLKQFGYLVGGGVLAIIAFKLPLPFVITWPLTVVFGLGGFGFAFVPIEERPMDVWVLSFIKSVYSPTLFVWQKTAVVPASTSPRPAPAPMTSVPPPRQVNPAVPKPSAGVPTPIPPPPAPAKPGPAPKKEAIQGLFSQSHAPKQSSGVFAWIDNLFVPHPAKQSVPPVSRPTPPPAPIPAPQPIIPPKPAAPPLPKPTIIPEQPSARIMPPDFTPAPPRPQIRIPESAPAPVRQAYVQPAIPPAPQAAVIQEQTEQMARLRQEVTSMQAKLNATHKTEETITDFQKQLTELARQKQQLEQELTMLKQQSQSKPQAPQTFRPAGVVAAPPSAPTVKVITPDIALRVGLPKLTTFPNVVTGIVKDHENNLLPGVLVTVRDTEDVPLRALKTNKLGQFAASTPLPNGVYIIEVEDPRARFTFDRAQVTLTGVVMPAIEVVAKSKRELDREKLAKEIFGDQIK